MSYFKYAVFATCTTLCVLDVGSVAVRAQDPSAASAPRTAFSLPVPNLPADSVSANHPLRPAIKTAIEAYGRMRSDVDDYTCIMVRQERVDGRLKPHQYIFAKVRHRRTDKNRLVVPFSVYLKFLKPASVRGREVLYIEGRNDGEMFARRGGTRFAFVTTRLRPDSQLAMRGSRYPITEFGMENMLYRLIHSAQRDLQTDCQVDYVSDAAINGRPAEVVIVTHQSRAESPDFYQARIAVDKALNLPVHYEALDWPEQPGGEPRLIEQYTYTQLKLNLGLTDADFSEDNPQYRVK